MKKALLVMAIWWMGYTGYQDANCMFECTRAGNSFSYCKKLCSF